MALSKATQQKIADTLNISRTTVSRALRQAPGPNRETAARIIRMATELGYRLPATPVSSRKRREAIGEKESVLLLIGESGETLTEPLEVQTSLINGAIAAAMERNLHLELHTLTRESCANIRETGDLPESIRHKRVGGVLIYGRVETRVAQLVLCQVPCVRIGSTRPGMDVIGKDNIGAARLLCEHLFARGHRKIGFIGSLPRPYNYERYAGYLSSLAELELPCVPHSVFNVEVGNFLEAPGTFLRQRNPEVTAWLCAHDGMGYSLMDALREQGRSVPQEFSLVGFDDLHPPGAQRKLTTIRWSTADMAEVAMQALLDRLENPTRSLSTRLFEGRLIEGNSVRKVRTSPSKK